MADKKLKIGKFEVPDPKNPAEWVSWELLRQEGWIGRVTEEVERSYGVVLTLQPAMQVSSPAMTPVMIMTPQGGPQVGNAIGLDAKYVFNQASDHPVRDVVPTSRQRISEMSEDLRHYIYNMIADAVWGPMGPDGQRIAPE